MCNMSFFHYHEFQYDQVMIYRGMFLCKSFHFIFVILENILLNIFQIHFYIVKILFKIIYQVI